MNLLQQIHLADISLIVVCLFGKSYRLWNLFLNSLFASTQRVHSTIDQIDIFFRLSKQCVLVLCLNDNSIFLYGHVSLMDKYRGWKVKRQITKFIFKHHNQLWVEFFFLFQSFSELLIRRFSPVNIHSILSLFHPFFLWLP